MERHYQTLQTIYDVVKNVTNPTSYPINPGQILIRQNLPWDLILQNIKILEKESLLEIKPLGDTIAIIVNETGIKKAEALQMLQSSS
jgi:hypothetical protein